MSRNYLPAKDSEEAQKLIKSFTGATDVDLDRIAKSLEYSHRDSLVRAMKSVYGVVRTPEEVKSPEPPTIIIPEIKIMKYEPKKGSLHSEIQGLCLGDWHYGEITPTYNPEVAGKRIDKVFQSGLRITELHRHMYPINELVVFLLGDMTHGENPFQGAKIGSVNKGAVDQVYDLAFPKLLSFLSSLRENFSKVTVYAVDGNHGKVSREAPDTSNFDRVLYKALQTAKLPSGIDVIPADDFCHIVTINNSRFFVHHGDATRATNGIPYFAQTRRIMSWFITYGGFDYSISGHWHKDDFYRISAKTKQLTNGALVSDDPFALKTIGTSSIPTQATFGIHPERGITWYYSLKVD